MVLHSYNIYLILKNRYLWIKQAAEAYPCYIPSVYKKKNSDVYIFPLFNQYSSLSDSKWLSCFSCLVLHNKVMWPCRMIILQHYKGSQMNIRQKFANYCICTTPFTRSIGSIKFGNYSRITWEVLGIDIRFIYSPIHEWTFKYLFMFLDLYYLPTLFIHASTQW